MNDYEVRKLMLCLKLNQQLMLYTPLSFKGLRAARLLAKLS